jgi:hypothetical protein
MRTIAILIALVVLTSANAFAADWQWPAQMSVGGFQISNVQGTVNANGSGSATGTLQIPGMGNPGISLSRSAQGNITGTVSIDAGVSGGSLRGSFALSNSGLAGRGTLECYSKSIGSSDIGISSRGEAKGSGQMSFGRLSVRVDFTASSSSCSISGEAPIRAQVDTPMASYDLDGRIAVRSSGGSLLGSLSGQVKRTGKVSNQITTTNIPNTRVDQSNGQCTVNVGGVSVTFSVL